MHNRGGAGLGRPEFIFGLEQHRGPACHLRRLPGPRAKRQYRSLLKPRPVSPIPVIPRSSPQLKHPIFVSVILSQPPLCSSGLVSVSKYRTSRNHYNRNAHMHNPPGEISINSIRSRSVPSTPSLIITQSQSQANPTANPTRQSANHNPGDVVPNKSRTIVFYATTFRG